jgi:hypothetical protein
MTPLHWIGEAIRQAVLAVPMGVVRALFVALFLGLLVWVLRLPGERTRQPVTGDGRAGLSGNLKLWAALALLIQALIYLLV